MPIAAPQNAIFLSKCLFHTYGRSEPAVNAGFAVGAWRVHIPQKLG
jgi:hypothetical protein